MTRYRVLLFKAHHAFLLSSRLVTPMPSEMRIDLQAHGNALEEKGRCTYGAARAQLSVFRDR